MSSDRNRPDPAARPPRKLGWIIGGILVALLVVLALNGLFRGLGEAGGITEAAPGDDDAQPAPEAAGSGQP